MLVKILLADDHKIVRDGLRSLIEKLPDMQETQPKSDPPIDLQTILTISGEKREKMVHEASLRIISFGVSP